MGAGLPGYGTTQGKACIIRSTARLMVPAILVAVAEFRPDCPRQSTTARSPPIDFMTDKSTGAKATVSSG